MLLILKYQNNLHKIKGNTPINKMVNARKKCQEKRAMLCQEITIKHLSGQFPFAREMIMVSAENVMVTFPL